MEYACRLQGATILHLNGLASRRVKGGKGIASGSIVIEDQLGDEWNYYKMLRFTLECELNAGE